MGVRSSAFDDDQASAAGQSSSRLRRTKRSWLPCLGGSSDPVRAPVPSLTLPLWWRRHARTDVSQHECHLAGAILSMGCWAHHTPHTYEVQEGLSACALWHGVAQKADPPPHTYRPTQQQLKHHIVGPFKGALCALAVLAATKLPQRRALRPRLVPTPFSIRYHTQACGLSAEYHFRLLDQGRSNHYSLHKHQ